MLMQLKLFFHVLILIFLSDAIQLPNSTFKQIKSKGVVGNWHDVHQKIDGFGASNAFFRQRGMETALTDAEAELFFSPLKGIGLSLLRIQVPTDGSCLPNTNGGIIPEDISACAGGPNNIRDITLAQSYGVKVWATPWSPPIQWKLPNREVGGILLPTHYGKWANYLAAFVYSVKQTTGLDLYAMSSQNEPNAKVDNWSAKWKPKELISFVIKHLIPVMSKANTLVIMPETSSYGYLRKYSPKTLPSNVIVAFHNYDYTIPKRGTGNIFAPRSLWETEVCTLTGIWDSSINDALLWAIRIHSFLVNGNINAWHWWWLTSHSKDPNRANQHLLNVNGVPAQRLFAIGSFSKFIRPGFLRIGITAQPQNEIYISAFRSNNVYPVHQSFSLHCGFNLQLFVPWLTADNIPLVQNSPIHVGYSESTSVNVPDNTFSIILPAQSITTLVSPG
jgi:glucuronoarabinoxylan endo-1,4-beta-xylanase